MNTAVPSPSRHAAGPGWGRLVLGVAARAALGAVLGLLFWASAPVLLGWHPTTVMTGSMMPRLQPGDVAVARTIDASEAQLGQVLLVHDPDHPDRLRLHRFVGVDQHGLFILKGDANDGDDSTHIRPDAVIGHGVLRVPGVGLFFVWNAEGRWLRSVGLLAGLAGLAGLAMVDRPWRRWGEPPTDRSEDSSDDDSSDDDVSGTRPGSPLSTPGRRPTARSFASASRVALFGAVALGLLGSTAFGPSFAAFSGKATNPTSRLSAAQVYDRSCAKAVLADNPWGYYQFEESGGSTVTDSSGNGRDGTYQGTIAFAQSGGCQSTSGRGIKLNGTDSYLYVNTQVTDASVVTTEIWFKTTTTTGGKLYGLGSAQTGSSGSYDRHLYMTNAGRLVFGVYNGARNTLTSGVAYNDGRWHHAVTELSSAGMQLFVDGALSVSSSSVKSASPFAGYWRVGYDNITGWPTAPSSYFFSGTVDDFAVYTTALSSARIAAHYNART